jgi:hypothetical protein
LFWIGRHYTNIFGKQQKHFPRFFVNLSLIMPYPVQALTRMHELASAEGGVLVVDEAVEDTLEENTNFIGHLFYNYSVLHCLPQAKASLEPLEPGTVI